MHLPGLLFHEHSSITGLVFYVQWLVFRDRFCDRYQFREYCSVISRHSVTNICDKCYVTGVPSVTGVLSPVCVPWPVFRLVSWVLFRDQPAFHDKCLWQVFRDWCSVTGVPCHDQLPAILTGVPWPVFRDRFCDWFHEYCSVTSRHSMTNVCDLCSVTGVPWPVFCELGLVKETQLGPLLWYLK